MKLIELLARELKEWPEGVKTIDQSIVDGELYGRNAGGILIWREYVEGLGTASDMCTANITRADWDAHHASATVTAPTTPTLETMLAEWRDLEARAHAAQAEADALFEHAGQLHGEIVVRLAELGWGAPRARMIPGEPVVTLDDSDGWIEWKGGECPVPKGTLIDQKLRDGRIKTGSVVGKFGNCSQAQFWRHDPNDYDPFDIIAYRLTPSTQP